MKMSCWKYVLVGSCDGGRGHSVVTVVLVWWAELQYQLSSLDDLLSAPSWSSLPRHPDIIITLLPAVHQNHSPHLTSPPAQVQTGASFYNHWSVTLRSGLRSGQVRSGQHLLDNGSVLYCSVVTVCLYIYIIAVDIWHVDNVTIWHVLENIAVNTSYCLAGVDKSGELISRGSPSFPSDNYGFKRIVINAFL